MVCENGCRIYKLVLDVPSTSLLNISVGSTMSSSLLRCDRPNHPYLINFRKL